MRADGNKKDMHIIVYLGETRPFCNEDYGLRLIFELEKNNYTVAALLLKESDPINRYPALWEKKRFFLPEALTLRKAEMNQMLSREEVSRELDLWLDGIKNLDADLGIVFYGNWLPPELFAIPKFGFINYHPGPLPYLRGIEPDTFIILEGWRRVWGAVHRVDARFDAGAVITKTKRLRVSRYSTPVEVLHRLSELGIEAILRAVKSVLNNKSHYKVEDATRNVQGEELESGSLATLARAERESCILWESDTNEIINRRLRAFCGQDIRIRLKAHINDALHFVYDLETYRTNKKCIRSHKEGTLLGYYLYQGKYYLKPIIKTIDGAAVLLAEEENGRAENEIPFSKEDILAPAKKIYETDFKRIEKSILVYQQFL